MTRNSKSILRSGIAALILTSGVALAQDQPPMLSAIATAR